MSFIVEENLIPGLPQQAYDGGVGKYLGVVAHATANNGDTADGERSYESTHWKDAFVHFFVDDTKILQVADYNYVCYGSGHTANHSGYVQVELCQSTDATKFANAYAKYVWLLAYILFQRHLGVSDGATLMSHAQVSAKWHESNHTDPIDYLASHGKTWANVVTDVTAEYKKLEGGTTVTVLAAIPANAIGSLVITTKLGLNLRSSAETSSDVLDIVPYNTVCPVITAISGWYSIQYAGRNGWVSAQYVTYTTKPVPIPVPVEAAKPVVPTPTPAVVPVAAPVIVPVVAPIVPEVTTPVPDINSIITNVLTDPANVLVLKQMYVFLNKIFGGR